jgi:hypothetical protein
MESARVKRIEIQEDKIRVLKLDGGYLEYRLEEVRRLATCESPGVGLTHALVVRGGMLYRAQELQFKGATWVERVEPETNCIVYEGPRFESAAKLIAEASKKLKEALELLSRPEVQSLVDFYNQYRGCSPEYTWVKNPAGTKYWYWYLKCPDKVIKSIYMGKSLGFYEVRLEAARIVAEVYSRLSRLDLGGVVGELELATQKLSLGELAEVAKTTKARTEISKPETGSQSS